MVSSVTLVNRNIAEATLWFALVRDRSLVIQDQTRAAWDMMNLLERTPLFFRSQHFKNAWRRSGTAEHGNLAVLFALLCFASNKSLEDSLAACWLCRCALCSQSKWWYQENSLCQVRIWEAFALISSPGFGFVFFNNKCINILHFTSASPERSFLHSGKTRSHYIFHNITWISRNLSVNNT